MKIKKEKNLLDNSLMFSKAKQVGKKNVDRSYQGTEDDLQTFTNQYLEWSKIRYYRVSDQFWRWIHANARGGVKMWFRSMFGGIPDNVCILPINDEYCLCLNLELKTGKEYSKLHGKQKTEAKKNSWQVARSPEQVSKIIDAWLMRAKILTDLLKKYSWEQLKEL